MEVKDKCLECDSEIRYDTNKFLLRELKEAGLCFDCLKEIVTEGLVNRAD